MVYEDFVRIYCDGKTPTTLQKAAIQSMLTDVTPQLIWMTGRGGGKSTVLSWLRKYAGDRGIGYADFHAGEV